jgi:hypothetical protein
MLVRKNVRQLDLAGEPAMRVSLAMIVTAIIAIGAVIEARARTMIGGSASTSCGAWTTERSHLIPGVPVGPEYINAMEDESWVLGFLSGIGFANQNGDDPLSGVDTDGIWAWVDNYCRDHPLDTIAKAATAFYHAHPR